LATGTWTAVLFDLDQTLIDSQESILQSFEHTWRHALGRELQREHVIAIMGRPLRSQMATLAGEEHADRLVVEYRRHLATLDHLIKVYEGFPEILTELRSRGYPVGIVTSKARGPAERHMALHRLDLLADAIVTAEDTVHHKPDPEPFLLAARRMDVAAGRCLAVGDSPWDILAAKRAGMTASLAQWGRYDPAAFDREGAQPDLVLESPQHLLAICPPISGSGAVDNRTPGGDR